MALRTKQRNSPIRQIVHLVFLLLSLVLGGCVTQQKVYEGPAQPSDFPEQFYLEVASDPQKSIYKIDSDLSQIVLRVYRGGAMARLGHDHVVSSQNVQGYIALNKESGQCHADFFAPLSMLIVDDPELRIAAELDTTPSPSDIAGTKNNMLISLEAANFPFVQLASKDCSGVLSGTETTVVLTLHGVSQQRNLQINLQSIDDNQLLISGEFSIKQTDFGIEPFSIMSGLIKVEDKVDLTYQLTAQRITP